jgi:hypothetical protein
MSTFNGVAVAANPTTGLVAAIAGPFPCTNTRNTFTPGIAVVMLAFATSANPSATGKIPPTFGSGGVTGINAFPVHPSTAPEQSAKLITIDGVPAAPNALGAGNNPSVNWSKLTSPATNDRDTAAYNTLHGPDVIAIMSPYNVEDPLP